MIGFIGYCHLLAEKQNGTPTVDEMLAIIRYLDAEIAALASMEDYVSVRVPVQPRLSS